MKFKYFNSEGNESGDRDFTNFPVLEGNKGEEALTYTILAYQANLRQGNASCKTRAMVKGTGKKPWRQKGTGMARHGSRRSPIWRTGGVAHGPHPRDYRISMNKKIRRLGLLRALSDSALENAISIVESFTLTEPKTKLVNNIISNIYNDAGKTVLFIDDVFESSVALAGRNIERLYMLDASSLNAWDIVRHDRILFTERGLKKLLQRLNLEEVSNG